MAGGTLRPRKRAEEQNMTVTKEKTDKLLIGGEWVDGTGAPMEVRSAWSGELIAEIDGCSEADVDRAVAAARAAQPAWAAMSLVERVERLRRLEALIVEHAEDIAQTLTRETGKTINET